MSELRPGPPGLALEDPPRPPCSRLLRGTARSGPLPWKGHATPTSAPAATSSLGLGGSGRIEPLAMFGARAEEQHRVVVISVLKSLAPFSSGVRKSSPRSPGRPRLRGDDGGGGGAPAASARDAAGARWPAGAKRSPKPGDTTGSFPGTPRRRCSGWSRSCPRHCPRCPGRRPPSAAAARRSPRRLAPRPAARHKVGRRWLRGAAPWGSHRFSTSS